MEISFKNDLLRELRKGNGRILLHDEVEERPGTFSIIPIWEVVEEHEIMTPQNVISLITKLGYRVTMVFYVYESYSVLTRSVRLTMEE
jgi:hypothetical protein